MTCRDTERLWNELLDARDEARPELEPALEAHAAVCPACAEVAARYRALRRAIAVMSPPTAGPEFVARAVEAIENEWATVAIPAAPPRRARAIPREVWLSAAAVLVASAIAFWTIPAGEHDQLADAPTPPPAAESLDLSDALADATSATLELARDASAPAGRLGRDVLASAGLATAEAPTLDVTPAPTSDVLRTLGGRVGAGVQPLSGSARHAFGFLLPAVDDDTKAPPPTPRSGA